MIVVDNGNSDQYELEKKSFRRFQKLGIHLLQMLSYGAWIGRDTLVELNGPVHAPDT